jgi:hypothetical protein
LAGSAKLMAVEMKLGRAIQAGTPKLLFAVPAAGNVSGYAVTSDGQRFLIPIPVGEMAPSSVTVLLNWTNALGLQ